MGIRRGDINRVQLFYLAQRRDAAEGLNAKLGAVLLARLLSQIRSSDEEKSRCLGDRLRQRSSRCSETRETDFNRHGSLSST